MEKEKIRTSKIYRASCVSIAGNTALSLTKILTGIFGGSIAVLSDGIDSATDVAISLIMVFTAKLMARKPDKHYVFGYGKAESIATKVLSMIIFFAGAQMLVTAIKDIFHEESDAMPHPVTICVTVISIVCKLLLSLYQTRVGKKTDSSMLIANGINMRNDVITSLSVLAGLFFTFVLEMPLLDSVTGIIVSLLIIRSSVSIFIDTSFELMDGVKDTSIYQRIFNAVKHIKEVKNPHRVRTRSIGGKYLIDIDIEVDGSMTVHEAHAICQEVEDSIRREIPEVYDIMVHVEPYGEKHEKEAFGIRIRPQSGTPAADAVNGAGPVPARPEDDR